jgi:DNA-binding MarR family transcriptional regulator
MTKSPVNRVSSSKPALVKARRTAQQNVAIDTNMRGLSAWVAVVRTYQQCSETLTAHIKPLGLKLAQHDVLMNLLLLPEPTQQALAEKSFVTKSHMSAVLSDMAELGWITRTDSAVDKRSKAIRLTPAGLSLAQQAFALQAQVVDAMMSPLSDKQIQELERVSHNALNALVAMQKP